MSEQPRCPCGHWWVDHDGFGCLIVSECQCARSLLAARDADAAPVKPRTQQGGSEGDE